MLLLYGKLIEANRVENIVKEHDYNYHSIGEIFYRYCNLDFWRACYAAK